MTPGELLDRLSREPPERTLPDRFPLYSDNPYRAGHLELERQGVRARFRLELPATPEGCATLALAAVERAAWDVFPHGRERPRGHYDLWMEIFATLISRRLSFRQVDAAALLALLTELHEYAHWYPWRAVLRAVEGVADDPEVRVVLRRLRTVLDAEGSFAQQRRFARGIDRLLRGPDGAELEREPGEAWTEAVPYEDAEALPLLLHAQAARGASPSRPWMRTASTLVGAFGEERFRALASRLFGRAAIPAGAPVGERNGDLLRGLVRMCDGISDEATLRAVGLLAEAMFRKVPGLGARSAKVGNACVRLLGAATESEAVLQLDRLEARVRYAGARQRIRRALHAAADRAGLTRHDLEELSVPDLGFDGDGRWRRRFGDVTCEIEIAPDERIVARWSSAGRGCRSVPASMRRNHASELKEIRALVRELRRVVPAQRDRIERLLLVEREWSYEAFRERYLDHPLMRHLARRLIWIVDGVAACWDGARLVDSAERPVAAAGGVALWHPLEAPAAEVQAWRVWLHLHGVRQPFKQVHREIYFISEEDPGLSRGSGRFVGHALSQHQFAALCRQRGWRYRLMGRWASHSVPQRDLPGGFAAEFQVLAPDREAPVSDHDVFLFVTADIVRFTLEGEPLELDEVPPRLFSEVMRDIALFVGVAGVGSHVRTREQHGLPRR